MLVVKPYGRSRTRFVDGARGQRDIHLNADPDSPVDIARFAVEHPEFVRAQWISSLDKIATKPPGHEKPTEAQRSLRDRLGTAALAFIVENDLVAGLETGREDFERVWWSKIHPYGNGTSEKRKASPKGRWFRRFAGDVDTDVVDADAIAQKIHEHLYEREFRLGSDRPSKRMGRIAARAESIKGNVPEATILWSPTWTEEDQRTYVEAGDVAAEILRSAREYERNNKPVYSRLAASILYAQYGRLFSDSRGGALGIEEASRSHPGLFALHTAIRDVYRSLLKGHRKKRVSTVLPADMPALFRLIDAKRRNRDVNALIRLGKVLHYEATPPLDGDEPRNIFENWPRDVETSHYWTSDGQSEIKRNEAFVRVWRGVVALASRTLTDWADPDGRVADDILGAAPIARVTGSQFDEAAFDRKVPLLFGGRSDLFLGLGREAKTAILKLALTGLGALRNSAFHFKGRGGFARALVGSLRCEDSDMAQVLDTLWTRDSVERIARFKLLMRASHFEYLFDQEQVDALFSAVAGAAPGSAPLPRFRRVLLRGENAWSQKDFKLRLPAPGNRADLEDPARLAQYQGLKLLYERAFPSWLDERSAEDLNRVVDRALARTTKRARQINKDEYAKARAAGQPRLSTGEAIEHFIDWVSAATATEFRVQRGYDSNPENARKQAKYLEDLKCDVIAIFFDEYLTKQRFEWLRDFGTENEVSETRRSDLDGLASPSADNAPLEWQALLYFLVHLVPVDEISRLYHQLRKWTVLEGRPSRRIQALQAVFDLYIDMHDAKFEGGQALTGVELLRPLFESDSVFAEQTPRLSAEGEEGHVPKRGLREIMRFATLDCLLPVMERHPVTAAMLEEQRIAETETDGRSPVALAQAERQDLHAEWVKQGRRLAGKKKAAYCRALATVVRHRHVAAHSTLTNHVRLHRLLMQVLGRLVDYAGLWERDLYFVTLALIHLDSKTAADVFPNDSEGKVALATGQVVRALRSLQQDRHQPDIMGRLHSCFGRDVLDGRAGKVTIRNDLAHFNLLRRAGTSVDLTETVNRTRRLVSHDRKLKNAVSKSIIELLQREGLTLTWKVRDHDLTGAEIVSRQAVHIGTPRLKENLHGQDFVSMAAGLFAGTARPVDDILSLDVDRMDWSGKGARRPRKRGKRDRNAGGSARRGTKKSKSRA